MESVLTNLDKKVIIDHFERIVEFCDHQEDKIKEAYRKYSNLCSRLCGCDRLPNVLLFGADITGPDLSRPFSDMILEEEERVNFYNRCQERIKEFTEVWGGQRLVGGEDLERAARRYSTENVFHVSAPSPSPSFLGPLAFRTKNPIHIVTFYNPELMPPMFFNTFGLYPLPQKQALERILLVWPKPFKLKKLD